MAKRCPHGFLAGTGLCPSGCTGETPDERKSTRKRIGEPFKEDPRVTEIVAEVAAELAVDAREIGAAQSGGGGEFNSIVRARAEVYRRARDRFRLSQVEVARALRLHPTTISYAVRVSA